MCMHPDAWKNLPAETLNSPLPGRNGHDTMKAEIWEIQEIKKMAKKAKGNRVQVVLECTEMKESGLPGTSRYITTKNRKNTPDRLELKKYNPILKRMTIHKEIK